MRWRCGPPSPPGSSWWSTERTQASKPFLEITRRRPITWCSPHTRVDRRLRATPGWTICGRGTTSTPSIASMSTTFPIHASSRSCRGRWPRTRQPIWCARASGPDGTTASRGCRGSPRTATSIRSLWISTGTSLTPVHCFRAPRSCGLERGRRFGTPGRPSIRGIETTRTTNCSSGCFIGPRVSESTGRGGSTVCTTEGSPPRARGRGRVGPRSIGISRPSSSIERTRRTPGG